MKVCQISNYTIHMYLNNRINALVCVQLTMKVCQISNYTMHMYLNKRINALVCVSLAYHSLIQADKHNETAQQSLTTCQKTVGVT